MIELSGAREMLAWSRARRGEGRRIGFVPTMGYLHEGHLRLIDRAREETDAVVVSVFVNPAQFGPGEDFERYPRDLARDRAAARDRGADCLFHPAPDAVYPRPAVIGIAPGPLTDHLCGPWRPGHFEGVLLVVAKLFHLVEPDVAVVGRKDAQQAVLIRRMVEDLHFPVRIVVAPTVREPDGLALSSRNVYLSSEERISARAIPRALAAAHAAYVSGERAAVRIVETARTVLDAADGLDVEYVELVDAEGLAPVVTAESDQMLAVAARVGLTRLIDNVLLGPGPDGDIRLAS